MDNREDIQHFWSNNFSKSYASPIERSEWLYNFIKDIIPKNINVYEIGANCGRNINYLREKGYTNVGGCDINKDATEYGRLHFGIKITHGKIEDLIKELDADCYFTMAVLEHIHPDSEWIFSEMAKAKYIVTVEDEVHDTEHHCPRNYFSVFKDTHREIKTYSFPDNEILDTSFKARLFVKK